MPAAPVSLRMARVVALYRYPVKGFTPEACEALTALPEGRIAGDRAPSDSLRGLTGAGCRVEQEARVRRPGGIRPAWRGCRLSVLRAAPSTPRTLRRKALDGITIERDDPGHAQ